MRAASKLNEAPPMMADTVPVATGTGTPMRADAAGTSPSIPTATKADKANESNTVTGLTIDLAEHDAAMVKLFECLGALKGAASFFVLDQGINSLAAIHDFDDDAIESLCKLCRKPKPGHPVALRVETQFQLCNFYLRFKAMTSCNADIDGIGLFPLAALKAYKQEID